MAYEVTREDSPGGGRYVARVDGLTSELTYRRTVRNGRAVILADHTGVPPALEGRGIALALVTQAVEDAKREGASILPLCSFVRVHMQRRPDWRNLMSE